MNVDKMTKKRLIAKLDELRNHILELKEVIERKDALSDAEEWAKVKEKRHLLER